MSRRAALPRPRRAGCADAAPDPRSGAAAQGSGTASGRAKPLAGKTAGDDLRQALDPHPRLVRGRRSRRSAAMPSCSTPRRCSSAAARRSPIPRACCRATSMRSCSGPTTTAEAARAGGRGHRAGDQRPHRPFASLPDHGRRDDLRGAPRARSGTKRWPGRRRQQRRDLVDPRRRSVRLRAAPGLPGELAPLPRCSPGPPSAQAPGAAVPPPARRSRAPMRRDRRLGLDGRRRARAPAPAAGRATGSTTA